ncbi:MAG: hypothetical protein RMJ55_19900 [Roseiflexaceae bacterium]|nr:hypothetical protein [Roseiflexus sp.]MDW8215820.1 hypothetical protein [Roseiflexaceae bacterium]
MPEIARKTIVERERKAPVAPLHTEERSPAVAGDQQRLDAAGAPGDIAARQPQCWAIRGWRKPVRCSAPA